MTTHRRYTRKGYENRGKVSKIIRVLRLSDSRYDSKYKKWVFEVNRWNPLVYVVLFFMIWVSLFSKIGSVLKEIGEDVVGELQKNHDFKDTERYWSVKDIPKKEEEKK